MSDPSSRPTVILTEHLDPSAKEWIAICVRLLEAGSETPEFELAIANAAGLIVRTYTRVDAALLDRAPVLKVVGRAGVGLDNIDLAACRERNITVVSTPDGNTEAVVEYVFGLILDSVRPRASMKERVAPDAFHRLRAGQVGRQLDRMTLGILGVGRIGCRIAQAAGVFGMRTLASDIRGERELALGPDWAGSVVDLVTLLSESDILTVHVDGRPSNRHLVDAEFLAGLKPECLLINTSRGFVVDSTALAAWAKRVIERGGRAVLDVHDPEPPDASYPLWGLPNVRLLPHLASRTDTAMADMSGVVRDVVRVLAGEAPEWPAW